MTAVEKRLTFAEHIQELRKRLMWSLLFVAVGAGVGYMLNDTILTLLQRPLNERLYYTTPTGGFSFILKVCCVFGLIVALPVVVYQVFAFFGPLVKSRTRRTFVTYVLLSVLLAMAGICFAYLISLPAALHFLVNFGNNAGDIQALITADEYFNFVLAYIAGFAVLFQLPLLISFINKATPLKPSQLIGGTRYVILGSFVISAIITPTPDPLNQALMAGPIILLYFVSVAVVAMSNASRARKARKTTPIVPELPSESIDAVLADEASLQIPIPEVPVMQPEPVPVPVAVQPPVPQHIAVQDSTPEPVAVSVSQSVQQAPVPARMPSAVPLVNRPVSRRVMMDVVGGRRPAVALRQPEPRRQRMEPLSPEQLQQPNAQMGLISDFFPAAE